MSKNKLTPMPISKEDVLQVARDLNVELNNVQIKEILKRYEDEQANDPTATWDLVIENLIYNL
jgi:NH3-dependent NAD+ synthetase